MLARRIKARKAGLRLPIIDGLPPTTKRLFAVAFMLYCLPGAAETSHITANKPHTQLEETLVTALKQRPIKRNDYMGSVSLVDREELQRNYPSNIIDIAAIVPGLHGQDTGARNPTPVTIRGLNFDPVSSNDLGSDGTTVASYVDDIPLQGYYSPPQFIVKDLARVEVLRGPQGTLYGASSLAGLIRYETRKPTLDEFSVNLHTRISQTAESNDSNYDSDIITNLPLVDDTFAARILLSYTDNGGFIDNDYLSDGAKKDINDEQITAARLHLLYQPSDRMTIALMAQQQEVKVKDRQADNATFTGKNYHASHRYLQPMKGDLQTSSLSFSYDFERATFEIYSSFYEYDQQQTKDLTDLYLHYYGYPSSYQSFEESDVNATQLSVEAKVSSQLEGPFNGVIGIFYSDNDLTVSLDEYLSDQAATFQAVEFSASQDQNLKDLALFTELNWSASPILEFTVGGRYFDYSDNAEACSAFATDPLVCYDESVDDNHNSFKIAGLYRLTDNINFYANISEGFRRGGANPGIPDELANRRNYTPDTTVNYEVGINSLLWQQRLRLNIGLFYIDWADVQLVSYEAVPSTGQLVSYIANANDAVSQGIELEIDTQLNSVLSLITSISYVDATLSQNAPSYNDADGFGDNGYNHDRLPGSPKTQAYMTVLFKQMIAQFEFDASVSANYIGNVTTQLNDEHVNYTELGGYTLLNANMGLGEDYWHVRLFMNNVTNKRAVTGQQGDFYYGPQGKFSYINQPRTVGVDVNYQF